MAKILLFNDSLTELLELKAMLHKHGYKVLTAKNGADGIALCQDEQPDVVLMDIAIPGLNGFQATRQLAQGHKTKHIPVIIVTTQDQETDLAWAMQQGASGYLTKPVEETQLLETLTHNASMQSKKKITRQICQNDWQGITFLLDNQDYLIQVESVSEILPIPKITVLPGVQQWVRGLANVRGCLITVVSLEDFLKDNKSGYTPKKLNQNNRIIIIKDLSISLIVDEVNGLQQFASESYSDDIPASIPENVQPFTLGSYYQDKSYAVFNIEELVTHKRFLKVISE